MSPKNPFVFVSTITTQTRAERRYDRLTRLTNFLTVVALFLAIADAGFCRAPVSGPDFDRQEELESHPSLQSGDAALSTLVA
jgi:hypothetical protein